MADDQEQMQELDELLHKAADSQQESMDAAIDVEALRPSCRNSTAEPRQRTGSRRPSNDEGPRRLGIAAPTIRVRTLQARWGSHAATSNVLTLHWPLFQLDVSAIDFVIGMSLLRTSGRISLATLFPGEERLRADLAEKGRHVWVGDVADDRTELSVSPANV